jgi:hypothetical protein
VIQAETNYEFTVVLDGSPDPRKIADPLYECGCDDALLSRRDGVVSLDFDRSGPSIWDAISSAIRDIEKTGLRVARIENVVHL